MSIAGVVHYGSGRASTQRFSVSAAAHVDATDGQKTAATATATVLPPTIQPTDDGTGDHANVRDWVFIDEAEHVCHDQDSDECAAAEDDQQAGKASAGSTKEDEVFR